MTGNVVFDTVGYNSAASGVVQSGPFEFTLSPGTYAVDWFVRGVPATGVPIAFYLLDVNANTPIAGSAFPSDGTAAVEQELNSSLSFVVTGAAITIALHNITIDAISDATVAFTPVGSPAQSGVNRSIRFLLIG